jgi:hypothetical protein
MREEPFEAHLICVEGSSWPGFWEKEIQNPARRKEDFDRESRSTGDVLREMTK